MKKLLFVMNPCAGMKKGNKSLAEILSVFNRGGWDVTVYITACGGDATKVVRQRAADFDLVVCAGGDGTFNETVTGVLRAGVDVPLGYIPCGTTNDLAASAHLPLNPVEAARNIVDGQPQRFDVGRFGEQYFTYIASFGAFTRVSYATPQVTKNAIGHAAYVLSGIHELSQIRAEPVVVDTEKQVIQGSFLFGAVSNSTSVGGVLSLDPQQVNLHDGLFELLLVRAPKDAAEVTDCIRHLQRQDYNCQMLTFLSAPKFRISFQKPFDWTLDGERAEAGRTVEIANLPGAIQIVTGGIQP